MKTKEKETIYYICTDCMIVVPEESTVCHCEECRHEYAYPSCPECSEPVMEVVEKK